MNIFYTLEATHRKCRVSSSNNRARKTAITNEQCPNQMFVFRDSIVTHFRSDPTQCKIVKIVFAT